jgi:hypothetical protein
LHITLRITGSDTRSTIVLLIAFANINASDRASGLVDGAVPGNPIAEVVGVRIPSFASLNLTYRFGRTVAPRSESPAHKSANRAGEFSLVLHFPQEGTFGLKGWRWQQRGKGVARASFLATLLATWRSVPAGLLVLLLLSPYVSGLLLLAGNETSSCGMQCCKGSKASCCRRAGKKAHWGGPSWIDSSKCTGGCGQLPAVSATPVAVPAAALVAVNPIAPESRLRFHAVSLRLSTEIGFASFERPPPAV